VNENHRRNLLTAFRHLDLLLSDALGALKGGDTDSPFNDIVSDATADQRRVVEENVRRIRERLVAGLHRLGILVPGPRISSLRAAHTSLLFAEIDLADLRPGRLEAYGEISEESLKALGEIRRELERLVERARDLLETGAGAQGGPGRAPT